MMSLGGQANSTGMPPEQKSKQSRGANLSLTALTHHQAKLWLLCKGHTLSYCTKVSLMQKSLVEQHLLEATFAQMTFVQSIGNLS